MLKYAGIGRHHEQFLYKKFCLTINVMSTEESMLNGEPEIQNVENVKPERKKIANGNMVLKGVSSRKRLVQALVSPRKKNGSKKDVQIGDGLYPEKPRKVTCTHGGLLPPKFTISFRLQ